MAATRSASVTHSTSGLSRRIKTFHLRSSAIVDWPVVQSVFCAKSANLCGARKSATAEHLRNHCEAHFLISSFFFSTDNPNLAEPRVYSWPL